MDGSKGDYYDPRRIRRIRRGSEGYEVRPVTMEERMYMAETARSQAEARTDGEAIEAVADEIYYQEHPYASTVGYSDQSEDEYEDQVGSYPKQWVSSDEDEDEDEDQEPVEEHLSAVNKDEQIVDDEQIDVGCYGGIKPALHEAAENGEGVSSALATLSARQRGINRA